MSLSSSPRHHNGFQSKRQGGPATRTALSPGSPPWQVFPQLDGRVPPAGTGGRPPLVLWPTRDVEAVNAGAWDEEGRQRSPGPPPAFLTENHSRAGRQNREQALPRSLPFGRAGRPSRWAQVPVSVRIDVADALVVSVAASRAVLASASNAEAVGASNSISSPSRPETRNRTTEGTQDIRLPMGHTPYVNERRHRFAAKNMNGCKLIM